MSNDIKFRAWDKLSQRFDKNYHIIISLAGKIENLQNGAAGDDYVIQRFTGLKDKEGKEIYEGDKLFVDEGIWLVVFRLGAFMVQEEGFPESNFGLLYEYNQDAFVMGNIFEKSE